MPKSTVQEDSGPYPLPKDEVFQAVLTACEAVTIPYKIKQGPNAGKDSSFSKWEWTFLITGPAEYANVEIKLGTEPKITDASEAAFLPLARPVVEALLGRSLELYEEVDTDMLLGLACQVTAKHLEPRPRKNGDGHWFNVEVDEVFPAHAVAQAAQAPAQAPQAPSYDEPPF